MADNDLIGGRAGIRTPDPLGVKNSICVSRRTQRWPYLPWFEQVSVHPPKARTGRNICEQAVKRGMVQAVTSQTTSQNPGA